MFYIKCLLRAFCHPHGLGWALGSGGKNSRPLTSGAHGGAGEPCPLGDNMEWKKKDSGPRERLGPAQEGQRKGQHLSQGRGHLSWVSKAEERGFGCSRLKGPCVPGAWRKTAVRPETGETECGWRLGLEPARREGRASDAL